MQGVCPLVRTIKRFSLARNGIAEKVLKIPINSAKKYKIWWQLQEYRHKKLNLGLHSFLEIIFRDFPFSQKILLTYIFGIRLDAWQVGKDRESGEEVSSTFLFILASSISPHFSSFNSSHSLDFLLLHLT